VRRLPVQVTGRSLHIILILRHIRKWADKWNSRLDVPGGGRGRLSQWYGFVPILRRSGVLIDQSKGPN
jgi:hypothetical protein